MINHNILRPEEYFDNLKIKEIFDEKEKEEQIIREKELEIERQKELKRQNEIKKEKEKLMAIKINQGDYFNIEPQFDENIEKNKAFQKDKLSKIAKIIEMSDKYFKDIPKNKIDRIIQNIYDGNPLEESDNLNEKKDSLTLNVENKFNEDYEIWENNCNNYREKFGFIENIKFNKIKRIQSMNNIKNINDFIKH